MFNTPNFLVFFFSNLNLLSCFQKLYLLIHFYDSILIDIHDILFLYIVLDTQLALIHICRTFGVSCDSVKSKLKNQISAWTTADNCKNGGEKCLYKVCTKGYWFKPSCGHLMLCVVSL